MPEHRGLGLTVIHSLNKHLMDLYSVPGPGEPEMGQGPALPSGAHLQFGTEGRAGGNSGLFFYHSWEKKETNKIKSLKNG